MLAGMFTYCRTLASLWTRDVNALLAFVCGHKQLVLGWQSGNAVTVCPRHCTAHWECWEPMEHWESVLVVASGVSKRLFWK